MSSTNRWYNRHKSDYYVTPQKDVQEFLETFLQVELENGEYIWDRPDRLQRLDPCAWWDELHDMSYPAVINNMLWIEIDTMDIREDSKAWFITDYLNCNVKPNEFDVIITNPPFNLALEIIQKALQDVNEDWYVIMLLRLNFFGSKARRKFFDEHMPVSCYVHHKRMSFTEQWWTDSIEYAHFVWRKWQNPKYTKLYLI